MQGVAPHKSKTPNQDRSQGFSAMDQQVAESGFEHTVSGLLRKRAGLFNEAEHLRPHRRDQERHRRDRSDPWRAGVQGRFGCSYASAEAPSPVRPGRVGAQSDPRIARRRRPDDIEGACAGGHRAKRRRCPRPKDGLRNHKTRLKSPAGSPRSTASAVGGRQIRKPDLVAANRKNNGIHAQREWLGRRRLLRTRGRLAAVASSASACRTLLISDHFPLAR